MCLDLMYEDEFIKDNMSLITGEPSPIEVIALENSEMLKISKQNIEKLKQTEIGFQIFFISVEWDFVNKQKKQIDLLLKTAE